MAEAAEKEEKGSHSSGSSRSAQMSMDLDPQPVRKRNQGMVSGGSQLGEVGHVGLFVPPARMAVQTSSPDVKGRLPTCQGQDGSQYMGFTVPRNFWQPT